MSNQHKTEIRQICTLHGERPKFRASRSEGGGGPGSHVAAAADDDEGVRRHKRPRQMPVGKVNMVAAAAALVGKKNFS